MPTCVQNQIALSRMGRFVPHVLLSGKEIIVGVRAYLDRSGTKERSYVTLAAFAGPDSTWAEFEEGWAEVLTQGFLPVPYFHVVEALGLRYKSPFCRTLGWERKHIWELLGKLIVFMGKFNRGKLTMHSCAIHMDAWRELADSGVSIPSEIDLCNKYVCQVITAMFANKSLKEAPPGPIINLHKDDLLNFVFDRSEPFFEPFRRFVNQEKDDAERTSVPSIFQFIDGVGEGEMKLTPGLQAADILAWGTNRENTMAEGQEGTRFAWMLRQIVTYTLKEFDRDVFVREFGPPLPNAYL